MCVSDCKWLSACLLSEIPNLFEVLNSICFGAEILLRINKDMSDGGGSGGEFDTMSKAEVGELREYVERDGGGFALGLDDQPLDVGEESGHDINGSLCV